MSTANAREPKIKERASVVFNRPTPTFLQGLRKASARPEQGCLDWCWGALLGYPGAQSSTSHAHLEKKPLKELPPWRKWEELPKEQWGCVKGLQVSSTAKENVPGWINQDATAVSYIRDGSAEPSAPPHLFACVFDGHGRKGHEVAQLAADRLPRHITMQPNLLSDPKQALEAAVRAADNDVFSHFGDDIEYSGTTCVAVLLDQGKRQLHIANVGDSRAVLGKCIPDAKSPRWEAVPLTADNKPDLPEELARIQLCGGHVSPATDDDGNPCGPPRVWDSLGLAKPGLGMSRTIGDGCARCLGVIADPVVTTYMLTQQDSFLLIATDGIWDSLGNEQAVRATSKFLHLPQVAMKALNEAVRREEGGELCDDTTAVFLAF